MSRAFYAASEFDDQVVDVARPPVRELALGQGPDTLVRIEFRSVGGEVLQVEPRVATAENSDRFTAVDPAMVQERDDVTSKVVEELAEEVAHVGMSDVLGVEIVVQAEAVALW